MSKFLETYLNNLGIEDFSLILEENALRNKEEIRKIAKALPANQKAEAIKQAIEILNKLRELKKVEGFSKVIDKLEPIKADEQQDRVDENQDDEEKKYSKTLELLKDRNVISGLKKELSKNPYSPLKYDNIKEYDTLGYLIKWIEGNIKKGGKDITNNSEDDYSEMAKQSIEEYKNLLEIFNSLDNTIKEILNSLDNYNIEADEDYVFSIIKNNGKKPEENKPTITREKDTKS